jgi:hypothetical protein
MPSAAECRQHAAECLRLAKEAKTNSDRDTLLKMAEEWAYAATLSDTEEATHSEGRRAF